MRASLALAACLVCLTPLRTNPAGRPNVIFILLDATRADRFGAWGNPRPTTPALDRLGDDGILFLRHFANAHSTRSSMPQLMTGRYYQQAILKPFLADEQPREYFFSRPDPTAALLPGLLRQAGYATAGVSAHPWIVADSPFGREFERLDFVSAPPSRGHADAPDVVERALAVWRERDRSRPLFLYLHFMDMHMPRFLPEKEPRFPVEGYDWRQRFEPSSEPIFNRRDRRWMPNDARAFTQLDRRHFAAVYDTRLAYADAEIGRLVAAVRADDAELRNTVFVVTADHGEELGEDGRTDHFMSLVDGVQHIPLIIAGGGVTPGQRDMRMTEHVDVVPTVLSLLRIPLPAGVRVDGRAQVDASGRVCETCGKAAVFYAWEEYRAVRTARYLLRQARLASFEARCNARETLYRMSVGRRTPLDPVRHQPIIARLGRRLGRRLDRREHVFLAARWRPPDAGFLVRPEFWSLGAEAQVACVPVDESTERASLRVGGWLWSGRGLALLSSDGDRPLAVAFAAPDGEYRVDAAVVPMKGLPWFSGYPRWRTKSFQSLDPSTFVPLGSATASGGRLSIALPAQLVSNRIVGLRLTPPGAAPTPPHAPEDKTLHDRLKALGYVN